MPAHAVYLRYYIHRGGAIDAVKWMVQSIIWQWSDIMNVFEKVFTSIENFFSALDARRRDAYLAEAQNVADLERRLRAIDSGSKPLW
jgi:hypothetical protein